MSSADWIYDEVARKLFGWHRRSQRWLYEDGTRVPQDRVPRDLQPSSARGTSSSSQRRPAQRQQQTSSNDDVASAGETSLDARVRALRLRDAAEDTSAAESSVLQWVRDDRAGVQSQWLVWPSQQLTDRNAPRSRTYRKKFIRGDGGDGSSTGDGRFADYTRSRNPSNDFKVGRVVELLYVSPAARTESAVTRLTPTSNNTDGSAIRARTRRFVIINGPNEATNSFTALPINTYNSQGVAPLQVIKSHHTIIYTSRHQPSPQRDEQPRRLQNGHLETPMREPSIRVEVYDRLTALDPLSRLDFCDIYEFDFNVPVKLFGRVHDSSRANLLLHYRTIWRDINLSVGQDAGVGRDLVALAELPGPMPAPVASSSGPRLTRSESGRPATYTETQIRTQVAQLQQYADAHELSRPRMTDTQLESYMANPQLFVSFDAQIRRLWRREIAERNAAPEEVSEEEVSDEDDSDDTQ